MKLQEKHKEFAVKCFARFMTRSEVVDAFIEEFSDDLPQPSTLTEHTLAYKWDIYFESLSAEELDKIVDNEGPDDEEPDIELSVEQTKDLFADEASAYFLIPLHFEVYEDCTPSVFYSGLYEDIREAIENVFLQHGETFPKALTDFLDNAEITGHLSMQRFFRHFLTSLETNASSLS